MDALQHLDALDDSASVSSPSASWPAASTLPWRGSNGERNHRALRLTKMGLNATAVGRQIGVTKNTVIGILWRAARRGEYVRPRAPYAPEGFDAPTLDDRLGWERVTAAAGCCWIEGEVRGVWTYCGERVTRVGGSYCELHHGVVYMKPKENSVLWMASNGVSEVKIAATLSIARSTVHDIKVGGRDRTEKPSAPPTPWVGRCFEDVPGLSALRISAMPLPAETLVWRSREIGE